MYSRSSKLIRISSINVRDVLPVGLHEALVELGVHLQPALVKGTICFRLAQLKLSIVSRIAHRTLCIKLSSADWLYVLVADESN